MEEKKKFKFEKFNIKTLGMEIFLILFGGLIASFGYCLFLLPHNILPGGFMGLARIIYDIFAKINFTAISTSLWYIILNIFLYIYAVKCLGYLFGIRAGVGIFSYSLFADLFEKSGFVAKLINQFNAESASSFILYAIFGGVLMGVGFGFIFRGNGSTGGCDMVAVVVNKFLPTITTGQIIICVDGMVIILSALVYQSLVLPLYALIAIYLSGKISDMILDGVKSFRAYYVVTSKKEQLTNAIFEKLDRGVTDVKCEGAYTHEDRDMLLIIVRRAQVITLKKLVREVDPDSFMFSHNVKEAFGKGFIPHSTNPNPKTKKDKNLEKLEETQSGSDETKKNSVKVQKTPKETQKDSAKVQRKSTKI